MVSWLPGLVLGTASVDSVLSEFSRPSHLSPVVGPLYLRYNGAVYSQVMLQSSQSSFLNKFQFLQCCHISDPSKRYQASVAENSIWDFQLLLLYVTDTGHLDSTDRDVKLQLPFELFLAVVLCSTSTYTFLLALYVSVPGLDDKLDGRLLEATARGRSNLTAPQ